MTFASDDPRPLAGIRVLDLATFIAAPYCATLMAEFGAEVIKVELPKVGDPLRRFGTPTDCGDSLVWLSESRNKKPVALDLRTPEGAALLKRLVREADVVCENFQPGTLEGWGLGWDVLSAENPALVMLRVSAYGQTGPMRELPGFGRIANAFGGISYLAGDPDRPPVTPGSATLADYMSGLYGVIGVLLALRSRDKTGKGQVVDIGLYESIFRILDELVPAYQQGGFVRRRMGAGTVNAVPHSHYPTKDDRWVAIACTNDKIFERLARLMGRPELAGDGLYGTIARREAARADVDAMVGGWTATMDRAELLGQCADAQVPCGPVYAVDEIFDDPQYAARENIARVDSRVGEIALPNVMPRLTETPGAIDWTGRPLAADNQAVFRDLLGLSDEDIDALREKGVI
jgi:crotonobetainyl-CoA:carnitine CoA-transferase CaiB-like acyl-CoA transferase